MDTSCDIHLLEEALQIAAMFNSGHTAVRARVDPSECRDGVHRIVMYEQCAPGASAVADGTIVYEIETGAPVCVSAIPVNDPRAPIASSLLRSTRGQHRGDEMAVRMYNAHKLLQRPAGRAVSFDYNAFGEVEISDEGWACMAFDEQSGQAKCLRGGNDPRSKQLARDMHNLHKCRVDESMADKVRAALAAIMDAAQDPKTRDRINSRLEAVSRNLGVEPQHVKF